MKTDRCSKTFSPACTILIFIWLFWIPLQERQRLETILTLCAEYNKGESPGLDPLGSGRIGFPGSPADGLARRPSLENVFGNKSPLSSLTTLRLAQKQRDSDEENLKEECSSTESTHQEVRTSPAPCTASALLNGEQQVRGSALFLHRDAISACCSGTGMWKWCAWLCCIKVSLGCLQGSLSSL